MSIITHTDHSARLRIVFDSENTAPVERYTIYFEGRNTVVVAEPGIAPAAAWQQVLELIADIRAVIRRGAWRGREWGFATVYAGIQPTEQQQKGHMKDWISGCLYQLAYTASGRAQVDALGALAKLHGLHQPHRVDAALQAYLLSLVEAELARRKVQVEVTVQ